MKHINTFMILGLCIHMLINISLFFDPEIGFLGYVALPFTLGNLVGLLLMLLGNIKTGARTFLYSSCFFVPIGLIAAFGARKVLDQLKKESFYSSTNSTL